MSPILSICINSAARRWATIVGMTIVSGLAACGGSSPSPSTTPPPPPPAPQTTVTGTAASGKPIAGATITVEDAAGNSATGTTASDGTFKVTSTTKFTPPMLVQVAIGAGSNLYSVSADSLVSTTINVTPLTDIITRSWYNAQGVSTDAAFAAPATHPAPNPTAVQNIQTTVQNVVGLWLANAGVPAGTDLISSPLIANSTGVDAVLDEIQAYAPPTASAVTPITLTNVAGTLTETVNLGYSTGTGTISITTNTSGAGGGSSSAISSVVPTTTAQQTALAGITTTLTNLGNTIATNATSLTAANVLPYLDPNLLDDGLNATQFADNIVSSMPAGSIVTFQGLQIQSLTASTADVLLSVTQNSGGNSQTQNIEWFFNLVGGSWLISGDNRIAKITFQAETVNYQGGSNQSWNTACGTGPQGPNPAPAVNLGVDAISGIVSGATVQDATIWTAPCTLQTGTTSVQNGLNFDTFDMNSGSLSTLPPAGSPFTFVLTQTAGGTVSYTLPLNAWTTEPISITSLSNTNGAVTTLAQAASTASLTVNWTLPTTYQITSIQLSAVLFTNLNQSSGYSCNVQSPSVLGVTSTTGTLDLQGTCNGQPVVTVNLNLSVHGVNGEDSFVLYNLQ